MIGSDLTKNIYKTPKLVFSTPAHESILYVSLMYTSSHTSWNRTYGNHLQL